MPRVSRGLGYSGNEVIAMDASSFWNNVVVPGVPIAEKIIRPIVVYVFLIVGLRLAGKRELAQLNPFDLVVLLTISNTVQNAIIGNDNSIVGGLIGAATLLLVNYLVVRWTFRHPSIERLVEGTPTALIEHRTLRREALERELITVEELLSAARRQGYLSIEDIESATLEPGGSITFTPHKSSTRVRRHDEIMTKLDVLHRIVDELRQEIGTKPERS
jgi:uncharacterized membrane protein YcaP (DUF421 family)